MTRYEPKTAMGKAQHWYMRYNVETGLYMLEPWEKALFNTVVWGGAAFTLYVLGGWLVGA